MSASKKNLFIDMDGVLVDFESGINKLSEKDKVKYFGQYDNAPGIFALMDPISGALDAINALKHKYNVHILSTSPWDNVGALSDKLSWIRRYFGDSDGNPFYKKVIFSHEKNLIKGDILIDDRMKNGADEFSGRLIQFGSGRFPDWSAVLEELL